ncbi:MAG: hypothetical protein AAGD07_04765 [Planctomycetota bacterium]
MPAAAARNDASGARSGPAKPDSEGAASTARQQRRRKRLSKVWMRLLVALGVASVLGIYVWMFGHVRGEEFSPQSFRTRTFEYYQIPFIGWQVTPIQRQNSTPTLTAFLRQKQWLNAPVEASKPADRSADDAIPPTINRWHLVSTGRLEYGGQADDAYLLVSQLRLTRGGNLVWKRWSQKHPEMAAVFWPWIQRLAARELYIVLPRLFEIVRGVDDVDALRLAGDAFLKEQYASLVSDMRLAGREDLSNALLEEALAEYPDHEGLLALQAGAREL